LNPPSKSYPQKLRELSHQYLFWLVLLTLAVILYVLSVQVRIGVPYWDVFNFLNNALYFAGLEGPGVKTRFSELVSFAGCVLYLSLAVLLPWTASGGIDVPAVSISIWAVYFLVKGIEGGSRLLYLVAPTVVLAVLTRYTAGLMVVPLFLYYLLRGEYLKNLKGLSVGILATLVLVSPLVWYFYIHVGNLDVIWNLLVSTATISPSAVDDVAYNPNLLFYLQNLPNYISISPLQGSYAILMNPSRGYPSPLAYLVLLLGGTGLLIYIYQILKSQAAGLAFSGGLVRKSITFTILLVTLLLTFNQTSYLVSVVLVFLLCYLAYISLRGRENEHLALDLLFLFWFLSYLIFHSILPIKVDRYFITMAPAVAYFLILGLSELLTALRTHTKKPSLESKWVYLALVLVLLSSATATYAGHTPKKVFVLYLEDASEWIMEQDPQYQNKIISSDYSSAMSWYLRKDVKGAFPRLYQTPEEFSRVLQSQNADYYVDSLSNPKPDIPGYQPVQTFQMVTIYRRINNS